MRSVAVVESLQRTRTLWIAAHPHRRTMGFCAAWDVPLRLVRPGKKGLAIWLGRVVDALRILRAERPSILFVANPSLVLTSLAYLIRPFFGYYLVVDAHNEGIRPFDRPGALVGWLTRRLLKGADATIVSNDALAKDVLDAGGRPFVLPDRLPLPSETTPAATALEDGPRVVVIATFRRDEPIAAIVEAAAKMRDVRFTFTGDPSRFRTKPIDLPPNVSMTGHLPEDEYWALLSQADIVCDLTLKPDCLVCGAYESLALAKPMVLTDDPATRDLFGPAAVLTGNEPNNIVTAIRSALKGRERLAAQASELRETYRVRWQAQGNVVWEAIRSAAQSTGGAVQA